MRIRKTAAVAISLWCALIPAPQAAVAAPPPGVCQSITAGGPVVAKLPWAQTWLAPNRVWPFSTGRNVTVAVIDSGVDDDNPQLRGIVRLGRDFLTPRDGRANFDCVGHGTAVASIIAAQPASGIGFVGMAPGARILPIRVSEREDDGSGTTGDAVNAAVFAKAIRYAADAGAKVINVSLALYSDQAPVRAAVRYAESRDALIIAAAGNAHSDQGSDPVTYPAAYPGVLGVGAITIDGTRLSTSQVGSYVDICAPGGGVLAAVPQYGYRYFDGTSFATAFVSGAAALLRSADPALSASQVADRLMATATPAPGPADQYGAGVVNPYAAVLDTVGTQRSTALPSLLRGAVDRAAQRRAASWHQLGRSARMIAVLAAVAAALVAAGAGAISLGRRRGWRAG